MLFGKASGKGLFSHFFLSVFLTSVFLNIERLLRYFKGNYEWYNTSGWNFALVDATLKNLVDALIDKALALLPRQVVLSNHIALDRAP